MKIFISHSSKNGELAKTFASFLGSLDSRIEVTCTSKFGTVKSAQDFKKEIENELKECDIFIPLFSNSYYLSKYSMIELGFAYARCCYEDKEISIIPFSIPPLKVSEALNKTPLNDLQVISIENREAIFHFANEIIRDRLKGDFTNDKIDKFIKHVNTLIYPINSENHEPESLPEKHAFDPEDIYNKAKSIVKVVANNCKNNKKYMDTLSSLLEEKNSPLKDSMIKKLDQLYRKHYMVELLDKLVEKHGHRFHSAANSYGNFNDLK
ncbi:MAG: toll/interleukin-1 receptor domain-containing protein, partial [Lachnoclostridium sp.]|nr:toll/interleukin-1 receptor domain-containing protein [Lachnoclostridium sp.]